MKKNDVEFGQMVLAKGILSVAELIRCVDNAASSKRDLSDVLISRGLMSNADSEAIKLLLERDDESIREELELGETIVLEAFQNASKNSDLNHELFESEAELEIHKGRYKILRTLGKGGMGEVFEVNDRALKRNVAMKRLHEGGANEKNIGRLILEAQVTGLLEHPSIVPVYDLRDDEDGNPFYIMRVVEERSLDSVLKEMREKEKSSFSLVQLISVLRQVSLAIQYAHDKGVIHRDLKPENILLGKYGEVYVIDWGIAKIINTGIGLETSQNQSDGLVGTPRYMAPEQARGESERADARSDVYALGAILYEIITLVPVFEADHILALLFKVVFEEPISPRERVPEKKIPVFLEQIALRALKKDPQDRFQSADSFAEELEHFLDGVKEAERKKELAKMAFEQAIQVEATFAEVQEQHRRMKQELLELSRTQKDGNVEEKRQLWDLEQQVEELSIEIERLFSNTINHYSQALVHLPLMPEAIEKIGALYWERFRDAERLGDKPTAAYFEGLVRQFNDGRYDTLLEGKAILNLTNRPKSSCIMLKSFQPVRRRVEAWDVLEMESNSATLAHGSYLLEVSGTDLALVKIPFLLDRGQTISLSLPTVPQKDIPEKFVYIHEGGFRPYSYREELVFVDSFAIQKYPVTVGEYLEFVNDIEEERALNHLPMTGTSSYFSKNEEGYSVPDYDDEGDKWELDWPILAVNYSDAFEYAKWKSEKEGKMYRLPTLNEWLKTARGVDGRVYSWGNTFDSSFCQMRDTERGRSVPSKVGGNDFDCSPYGVYDLSGNIAEWTSTIEEGTTNRFLGGASYNSFAEMCKLDFTMSSSEEFKFGHYGIRLVLEL